VRLWSLLNVRNPLWNWTGVALVAGAVGATGVFIHRVSAPPEATLKEGIAGGKGGQGQLGTIVEQLGVGRFLLRYARIEGNPAEYRLEGVQGRLEEPQMLWEMQAPEARRRGNQWILDGPMQVVAKTPAGQQSGQGSMAKPGPALQWSQGVWLGLQPLVWENLDGPGRGSWSMPSGWHRDLDGRFYVDDGPVRWEAKGPGALRWMEAQRLWVTLGFQEGHLEEVRAGVEGGLIEAPIAEVSQGRLEWPSGLRFKRDDGWEGQAQEGAAPRPEPGQTLNRLDLKQFQAHRTLSQGREHLTAGGVRWTPSGLQVEGDVRWEQPAEGYPLVLRAPRVLMREAAGGQDLPANLALHEARAEGRVVLTWNGRSLSTPVASAHRLTRQWQLQAPVQGRSEWGTFSSAQGQGGPDKWIFQGPIQAWLTLGGAIRGDRLEWEQETWTFTGRPATWERLRERLSGPRVVRKGERIEFPQGINGALAAPEGNLVLRADQGRSETGRIVLTGRVECRGQGYRIQADQVEIGLGPGNLVKRIAAVGQVQLEGRMGEGRGDLLELDPGAGTANWQGKVRGRVEGVQR